MTGVLEELEHDPGQVRDKAWELLSRPPYAEGGEGPLGQAWREVREWLAERLAWVLERVGGDATVAWVVVAVGVVVLVLVVWRATRGLAADRAVAVAEAGPAGRPARQWHADADAHEAAGAWREAVRCRYRALVGQLVETGVVEDVAGRTVGELDRELTSSAPALADDVAAAGDVFAWIVYGHREAGPEDARRVAEAASRVARPPRAGAGARE